METFNTKAAKMTKLEVLEYFSDYSLKNSGSHFFKQAHKLLKLDKETSKEHEYIPNKFNNHIPFPDLVNNNEMKTSKQSPFLPINPIKSNIILLILLF